MVVKYPRNPIGNKVLINEWIANKIAKLIHVPIPDFGCCYIDNESSYGETFYDQLQKGDIFFDEANFGLCFYSKRIIKAMPLSNYYFSAMKNTSDFWNMLLFDYLVGNVDRHRGNLLYSMESSTFYAIDCSNIFNSQRGWTVASLKEGIHSCDYKDLHFMESEENGELYSSFWPYAELTQNSLLQLGNSIEKILLPQEIAQIVSEIPPEWNIYLTDEERKTIIEYLTYRVAHINDVCITIAKERGML